MSAIIDLPAERYHADELVGLADGPTLSATIAKILLSSSPRHAWTQHPKLNPNYERVEDDKFSVGVAAHALLLEGRDAVEVLPFSNYTTNPAKAAKKEARAAGKIPMLEAQWAEVQAMCAAVKEQLPSFQADPPILADGKPEQTIVWQEDGVTCRALIDWLHDDFSAIDDVKTTRASAEAEAWTRTLYGMSADVQVAFNRRAVKAATGIEPEFRFVVIEVAPPYEMSLVSLSPSALALANDRMNKALAIWKRCLATDTWPGFDRRIHYVDMPGYLEYAWMERDAREAA